MQLLCELVHACVCVCAWRGSSPKMEWNRRCPADSARNLGGDDGTVRHPVGHLTVPCLEPLEVTRPKRTDTSPHSLLDKSLFPFQHGKVT